MLDPAFVAVLITLFATHAIPFVTLPSWVTYIAYISAVDPSPPMLLLMAVLAGVAAAGGKLVVFLLGRATSTVAGLRKRRLPSSRALDALVLLAAATPVPDDVLYIPLGVAGYSMRRFAALVVIGKIIAAVALSIYGSALDAALSSVLGSELSIAVMVALTIMITLILIKLDLEKTINRRYSVGE